LLDVVDLQQSFLLVARLLNTEAKTFEVLFNKSLLWLYRHVSDNILPLCQIIVNDVSFFNELVDFHGVSSLHDDPLRKNRIKGYRGSINLLL